MGRPSNHEERREQIIVALRECMKRTSYYETSTRDIASEAGVLPSLVYHYFGSKKEILLEMAKTAGRDYDDSVKKWMADLPDAFDSMETLIDGFMKLFEDSLNGELSEYHGIYSTLWSMRQFEPELRKCVDKTYSNFVATIEAVLKKHLDPKEDSRSLALLTTGIYDSYITLGPIFGLDKGSRRKISLEFFRIFRTYKWKYDWSE